VLFLSHPIPIPSYIDMVCNNRARVGPTIASPVLQEASNALLDKLTVRDTEGDGSSLEKRDPGLEACSRHDSIIPKPER